MKSLVIFYSFTQNTKFIAETIAKNIDADLMEIKPIKDIQNKWFMKYIWWWRQVFMKEKPILYSFDKNPNDYDLIFIGTPVWAFSYAPAFNSFFDKIKIINKKIALFSCSGWMVGQTFKLMKNQLSQNEIISEKSFIEPLKRDIDQNEIEAKKWSEEIIDNL